jgi:hypothetical protein
MSKSGSNLKAKCSLHGEQEFLLNKNGDAFCSVCYQENMNTFFDDFEGWDLGLDKCVQRLRMKKEDE